MLVELLTVVRKQHDDRVTEEPHLSYLSEQAAHRNVENTHLGIV